MTTTRHATSFEDPLFSLDHSISVLFLVYRDVLGPIFSSIYVQLAQRLSRHGFEPRILAISSLGEFVKPALRQKWRHLEAEVKLQSRCELLRLPSPPRKLGWLRTDGIVLRAWTAAQSSRRAPEIVHCSSSKAADLAMDMKATYPQMRVVYHCLGPEASEYLYSQAPELSSKMARLRMRKAAELDKLQGRALRDSDAVIYISHHMADWARSHFGVDRPDALIMPCHVNTARFSPEIAERDSIRRRLGLTDRLVVCYSGSMISWQLLPQSLKVLIALQEIEPNVHFLGVTMHQSSLRRLLENVGFPEERTTIVSASHWEVPEYLSAADIGLIGRGLLQSRSVIHEVSSPIKYGEYLACGTPVIMSEGIGDFSALTVREGIGVVLRSEATGQQIRASLGEFLREYQENPDRIRTRCVETANRELDMNRHVGRLVEFYSRLVPADRRLCSA